MVPRLADDLADLLEATAADRLADVKVSSQEDAAVTVVLAGGGYPGPYSTGVPIRGLDAAGAAAEATVFHAGTARRGDTVVTAGGRVLAVSALGPTLGEARAIGLSGADRISFDGKTYRRDIAPPSDAAGEEEPR